MRGEKRQIDLKATSRWGAFAESKRWRGYVIAVIGPALGMLLRIVLVQAIGDLPLYLTFYPVVFAAAVFGGAGPGLVATFLSAVGSAVLFVEPLLVVGISGQEISLAIFILLGIGLSLLGGRFRSRSEALRESDAILHLTCHATGVGAFDRNLQTDVNNWTPELEAMHGLKPGEFGGTGASWEQLVHPEDRQKAFASVERALRTFQPVEEEWRVVWSDGSVHWVVARFQAFGVTADKPPRLVGINIDITARKEAEIALRQREEWFRTMADSIPELAWICRPDGYNFWFNRRCFEYFGLSQEELEGWGWMSVVDPEALSRVTEQWERSVATGEPFHEISYMLRGRDGRFRPFLANVVPLKDHEGRVSLWFGTATDISELRERERAVTRQARLIDLAPAATMVFRLDGTITFWSKGAERFYGWTRQEALGRRVMDLLRTEFPEPRENIIDKLRGGGAWSGELKQYTRDGREVVVESYWLAELNAQGQVDELLQSNTDITQRKRLQEHLEDVVEDRTAELRETVADLEHMSYSMIHDMRGPLRAMQSFAYMLEEEVPACRQSPGVDYLRRIRQSSLRLDRLITDALNYSELLREEAVVAPVDLGRLLHGMIDTYPNFQPRVADIVLDFEHLTVLGNESLLTQCFGNLLDNAVKFVARGVRPSVHIWAQEMAGTLESDIVRIWVEDNGIGIAENAQEKIFRMFQRMRAESEYPGTGIGLAMVKKAVERMHGHVGFESQLGRGSRFWVELPVVMRGKGQEHGELVGR